MTGAPDWPTPGQQRVGPAPPYDAEMLSALEGLRPIVPPTITASMIPSQRLPVDEGLLQKELNAIGAVRHDVKIAGHNGDPVTASVIGGEKRPVSGPAMLYLHPGGMVLGSRFDGVMPFAAWALRRGGVVVTVEYRLAPEFPDPYPVEDCYAALLWLVAHAEELDIDPDRIVLAGLSAGGGLAAGTSLLSRDRCGPAVHAQLLGYPMLDDRALTGSTAQFEGVGVWDRISNATGWRALLGNRVGTDSVSVYAAPARADDLRGLPPAYIEVGSAEVFRDECVAYASRMWAIGGQAELHVWPGAFHACDLLAPSAAISRQMVAARDLWLDRVLRH